jgi:hypothetical protein
MATVNELIAKGHRRFKKPVWALGNFITLNVIRQDPVLTGPWVELHDHMGSKPRQRLAMECGLDETDWEAAE